MITINDFDLDDVAARLRATHYTPDKFPRGSEQHRGREHGMKWAAETATVQHLEGIREVWAAHTADVAPAADERPLAERVDELVSTPLTPDRSPWFNPITGKVEFPSNDYAGAFICGALHIWEKVKAHI